MNDLFESHYNGTANDTSWEELIPHDPGLRVAHLTYFMLGIFITCFGLISLVVKDKLYMSEAMVATLFGIIIGPAAANIFNPGLLFPGQVDHITLEFARLVIAIQCLVAGIALPGNYLWKEIKSIGMLLGPVMLYMWLMSALAIWAVFGVPWQLALIIAGCVTPTDPVLSNSIVKGTFAEKHIPYHVRLLISAESGANDGLGVPLIFLPVYLWRISNAGSAVGWWLLNVIVYQIILCVAVGIVIGYASRKALKYAELNGWIDKESILGFFIAIALATTGLLATLGVDDVLGCFVVGTVLSWDQWFNQQIEETHIQEVLDAVINIVFFVYFGTLIPWQDYTTIIGLFPIWRLVLLAVWLLLLRRLPIIMLLRHWIPALKSRKEAFFCGWFGPIGAGALFYAMIAIVYLEIDPKPLFPIVAFIILSSIILHGGSVSLFEFGITRHSTWQNNRLTAQISAALQEREQRQLQHERELRIRTNLEGNATSSTGVLFSGVGGFLRQFWTHSQPFTESPDRTNSVPSHFASSPMGDLARPSREHSAQSQAVSEIRIEVDPSSTDMMTVTHTPNRQDMDLLHTNGDSAVSTVRPPASPNGNLDTDTVMVDNVTGTTDATGGRSTSPLLMVHTS
ncbi:hypothetical protein BASA50_001814 [Batrachochytrium salamandrivorans]|uniref:Cation/H+ exchanger transmembrane domain-containing protein n=1 Tax=Batrachochytrium salamandrivorans TaxID=1357716 RepID=A0ABQ8FN42_9FUNG|nr:hypothetical protein BASA62_009080 [Batrachochytrium salamandrivorans]KAH6583164.1 hypothetical protein BASA61_008134 [Batrachochytrium salamandrivorans]KAH6585091.1 hypothetical protein BASA60_000686 [Batrachochytrium salamandrivorans]KAH6601136.1 hypothetical protein BASA50_001814 [Batrachochytrium salamandrivorans]KAH9252771.1 hypothetical protein BASA81_009282 [Batrachochytrium salamandrivorans]